MYDVLIIGAGIAGLSAALYSARLGLKTLLISRDLGGQAILAPEIQNYPGFSSISGMELIRKIEEQVRNYGISMLFDEVNEVKSDGRAFLVKTVTGKEYKSLALILAIGKAPRELKVPGESKFKGRGVSYCTICDAPLFKGKKVALVGIGEAGLHGALTLSEVVKECYWVFPGSTPGAISKERLNYLLSKGNVKLMPNSKVIEIKGDIKVKSIVIKDLKTGEVKELNVDGVFIEMGYEVKTEFLKGFIKLNEKGEIIVDKLCKTSREGVFAAGDVTDIPYKQAIISAAQGAIAALSAYNYIAKIKGLSTITSDWRHVPIERKEEEGGFFLKL
ncbi:MAG: thioredoxin reductase [Thermoprotei archaeon]|nr:MAG: thioredoxin reductase [Thermoprotei archaeon]